MPVSIDQVTTSDSQPTTAPHRISDKPGFRSATVEFTMADLAAYEVREGGTTVDEGRLIKKGGRLVCGRFKVGAGQTVNSFLSSAQQDEALDYADFTGDGDHDVLIWGHFPDGGWS